MTKICVLEIGARVIDTNNEDYTCLYQDWYEGESETLDLFYHESTFNTNFFLGKNSHLLTESIQHTFYDITSRLNNSNPKEYSDSSAFMIKLCVQPGNLLDAAKSKVNDSIDCTTFFEELLSDSFDLKIDNNAAKSLLKSHYQSQKETTEKNWYVNDRNHQDIKNTDWYNGFVNTYYNEVGPNNAEQDFGSSFALGLKAALNHEAIDTPENLEFAKGYAVGQLIVKEYFSRLASPFENLDKDLQQNHDIADVPSIFTRI